MEMALSRMTQKTLTCDQYLDKMKEILSGLTSGHEVAEDERVHLRAVFKQLLGFVVRQQQADIRAGVKDDNALQTALAENDQLSRQKHVQLRQHVARIGHLKQKITNTSSITDQALYTHTLAFLEDIAADDEFKWDLHIVSHWYNAITKTRKAGNACQHRSGMADEQPTEITHSLGVHREPRELSGSNAIVTSPSNVVYVPPDVSNDVAAARKTVDVGAERHGQQSLVAELDSFVKDISVHLLDRLENFHEQIAVLRQNHRASYSVEMDKVLAALADVASVGDVACIKKDILHLELVGNQAFVSTIVDKTQEKYERALHLPQKHAWAILLERVKALRHAYSVGIDLLQQQTIDLVRALDRDIDSIMVRTAQLDTAVQSLDNDNTRLRVREALDDLVSRISPQ
ncbi:unnamed protein product [Ectocarpus sp. 6 AP-2014]